MTEALVQGAARMTAVVLASIVVRMLTGGGLTGNRRRGSGHDGGATGEGREERAETVPKVLIELGDLASRPRTSRNTEAVVSGARSVPFRPYDGLMARATRWSEAVRLTGGVNADWRVGEDPEACAVEVLFVDGAGTSYVVFAVGPSSRAAVAAAEEEARRRLGCEAATDWRAA